MGNAWEVRAIGWTLFVAKMMPDAIALLRVLYRAFHGDVEQSKDVLRRIRHHGVRLDEARAEIDKTLAELRAPKPDA